MQRFKTLKYTEKTIMLSAAELSKWGSLIVVREQLLLPIFSTYINEMLKSLMLLFLYSLQRTVYILFGLQGHWRYKIRSLGLYSISSNMDRVAPFLFCATNMHHIQLTTRSNLFLHVAWVHYSEMIFEVDGITLPFIDSDIAVQFG